VQIGSQTTKNNVPK